MYPDLGILPMEDVSVESPIIKTSFENLEVKSYGLTGAHFLPLCIRPALERKSGAF